jgi:hypothetical protein
LVATASSIVTDWDFDELKSDDCHYSAALGLTILGTILASDLRSRLTSSLL